MIKYTICRLDTGEYAKTDLPHEHKNFWTTSTTKASKYKDKKQCQAYINNLKKKNSKEFKDIDLIVKEIEDNKELENELIDLENVDELMKQIKEAIEILGGAVRKIKSLYNHYVDENNYYTGTRQDLYHKLEFSDDNDDDLNMWIIRRMKEESKKRRVAKDNMDLLSCLHKHQSAITAVYDRLHYFEHRSYEPRVLKNIFGENFSVKF